MNGVVDVYSQEKYEQELQLEANAADSCLIITKQGTGDTNFTMCVYPEDTDLISDNMRRSGQWESSISELFLRSLEEYGDSSVFVDIGGNLGVHSLFVASKGFKTFSVEPMPTNLVRFYRSVVLSDVTERITLIQNAIGDKRKPVWMSSTRKNFGNSKISSSQHFGMKHTKTSVNSILLSDILDFVSSRTEKFSHFVVKLDIEGSECQAILGSGQALPKSAHYFIPIIVMEWTFDKKETYCLPSKVKEMREMLENKNYTAFSIDFKTKLDLTLSKTGIPYGYMDVAWVHKDATFFPK